MLNHGLPAARNISARSAAANATLLPISSTEWSVVFMFLFFVFCFFSRCVFSRIFLFPLLLVCSVQDYTSYPFNSDEGGADYYLSKSDCVTCITSLDCTPPAVRPTVQASFALRVGRR